MVLDNSPLSDDLLSLRAIWQTKVRGRRGCCRTFFCFDELAITPPAVVLVTGRRREFIWLGPLSSLLRVADMNLGVPVQTWNLSIVHHLCRHKSKAEKKWRSWPKKPTRSH